MSGGMQASASGPVRRALHDHWRLFLIEGIILIILGSAAIIVPPIASLAVAITLGWIFLVVGIVGLVTAIAGRTAPGFWWALLSSIITIVAGVALIGFPVIGAVSITFVLTAYLVIDGVLMVFFAIDHRRELSQRWIMLMINGILDLALAAIIILALPASALWALGIIIGIDLVFGGFSLVAMALAARKAT